MRKPCFALILACASLAASAMPSQFDDDGEGWIGLYASYSLPAGGGAPSYGFSLRGAGPGHLGIDFSLMLGGRLGLSCGAVYFAEPAGAKRLSLPISASLGYFADRARPAGTEPRKAPEGFGASLSAGANLYALGGVYSGEDDEAAWVEIGGRAAAYWYGRTLALALEGVAGASLSLRPEYGGGYYYVYY